MVDKHKDIGARLLAWRKEGTKPIPRREVADITGFPPHKILTIERGSKLKAGEYDKLVWAIPELHPAYHDELMELKYRPMPADLFIPQGPVTPPAMTFPKLAADEGSSIDLSHLRPVSNSEIATFTDCRRKWWLSHFRKLALKDKAPVGALRVGTRIHAALEVYYSDDPTDPFDALDRAAVEDWTDYQRAMGFSGQTVPAEVEAEFHANIALERTMLQGYLQWLEDTGADSEFEVVSAETFLQAPFDVGTAVVRLVGKVDLIVRRKSDGVRLVMDHKTSAAFARTLAMVDMSTQMLTYHLLETLTSEEGERCGGAVYSVLRKTKRGVRAKEPFYTRREILHNDEQLKAFRSQLTGRIRDMIQVERALLAGDSPNVVAYPSPSPDCSWKCEFVQVCPMFDNGSRVEDALQAQFTTKEPMDRYMTKSKETETR